MKCERVRETEDNPWTDGSAHLCPSPSGRGSPLCHSPRWPLAGRHLGAPAPRVRACPQLCTPRSTAAMATDLSQASHYTPPTNTRTPICRVVPLWRGMREREPLLGVYRRRIATARDLTKRAVYSSGWQVETRWSDGYGQKGWQSWDLCLTLCWIVHRITSQQSAL